ncbi:hypothetical protein [Paraglaciecola sp. L1A13]|uniref:hypothetical protein n=1 Tax=Paraglaciecola sp. L1A13 TaxID=2686359 RepID=UPI00131BFBEC|nr:hypothetical protein [Paraglaciecola sp. L1A13]|tara:strand:- start:181 stop:1998 length:1818 start_codon:yes stop_codon:yes gene_type:complete
MKKSHTSYVYKYKTSSNYFFRLRAGVFEKMGYDISGSHFVASLGTPDFDDARWLALYIKRNLMRELHMESSESHITKVRLNSDNPGQLSCFTTDGSDAPKPLPPFLDLHDDLRAAKFRVALRKKFEMLLKAGKIHIESGIGRELTRYQQGSDSDFKNLTARLDFHSNISERKHLVSRVTQTEIPLALPVDTLNSQYLECVKMLNALVTQLNELQKKSESYEYINEINESFSHAPQIELLHALSLHKEMQDKLHGKCQKELAQEASFYSIKAQFEKFKSEKSINLELKTLMKYEVSFELLYELVSSSFDARTFSKVETQDVKHMLLNRFQNESKGCRDKHLSTKTINGILSNYRTFFTWFIKNVHADMKNPFEGVSIAKAKGKAKGPKRRSFTAEEIRAQLNYQPIDSREARDFRDDASWYLPISLYTGMRLNEMSALPLSHIKLIENLWCFDLHGLDVKNEASERTIPIAQYLLDKGFIEYVDTLKKSGQTLLFSQIRKGKSVPGSSGWGDPISRWFNRTVLKNIGINTENEKKLGKIVVFHCNRRTMISKCVQGGAEHYLIKRIAGHSQEDDITLSVYSDVNEIPLALLKSVLDTQLTWHTLTE